MMRILFSLLLSIGFVQTSGFVTPDLRNLRRPQHVPQRAMVEKDIEDLNLTPQLKTMAKALGSISDEKTRYKQLLFMANKLEPMDPNLPHSGTQARSTRKKG